MRRSAKADLSTRTSPRRSAKADLSARTSPRRSGKADPSARSFARRSGKADPFAGLSHGEVAKPTFSPGLLRGEARKPTFLPGFGRRGRGRGGKNGALPYIARGSKFYKTTTKGDFFVATSSPLVNLLFRAGRAKLWVRRGKAPAAKPRRPARPPPTTVTGPGSLATSARSGPRRPCPGLPAREGSLGAPYDRSFPLGARRKARKGKTKRKEEPPDGTTAPDGKSAPALPTPGLSRPLRLTMAGRAPSRHAPCVAESPQNQRRRSLP